MSSEEAAAAAKERHSMRLLERPGVSGVGTARRPDGWIVEVHVDPDAVAADDLPSSLDGVPVVVVPDGPYRARPAT